MYWSETCSILNWNSNISIRKQMFHTLQVKESKLIHINNRIIWRLLIIQFYKMEWQAHLRSTSHWHYKIIEKWQRRTDIKMPPRLLLLLKKCSINHNKPMHKLLSNNNNFRSHMRHMPMLIMFPRPSYIICNSSRCKLTINHTCLHHINNRFNNNSNLYIRLSLTSNCKVTSNKYCAALSHCKYNYSKRTNR